MKTLKIMLALGLVGFATTASAQAIVVKPDGQWRAALGAGLSLASGNTSSRLLNINGDMVKATATDKLNYYGSLVYGKNGSATTADMFNMGARYNRDLNPQLFWFGQGDLGRNKLANLSTRTSLAGGMGYHVVKTDAMTFDVFAGLGFSADSYINSTVVAGQSRSSYNRLELLVGEESTHRLTPTTAFKQRLVIYPNMSDRGEFRAVFDAGLSVAMSNTLSLTTTVGMRHNSDPGTGFKKTDMLLFSGISYKLD